MNFSKQYLVELAKKTNFIRDNLEKVLRLAEILKFLNTDPVFKDNLALKGGTAINLTSVELPRLSVDIDLDFTKNLPKDEITQIKEKFTKRLTDYMWQEGYSLMVSPREHYALLSFVFNYVNNANNRDNIKIEINFMDRCHILPLEYKEIKSKGILEPFKILTLNTTELYASKINALLSRATPRDLYDVNTMIKNDIIRDKELLRKCLIFYNMIGGEQDINNLDYSNIDKIDYKKFKTQLKPVISKTDTFNLDAAKIVVKNYLKNLITLQYDDKWFIHNFRANLYMPNLLFTKKEQTLNVVLHPMAIWRCSGEIKFDLLPIHNIEYKSDNIEILSKIAEFAIDTSDKEEKVKKMAKIFLEHFKQNAMYSRKIDIDAFVKTIMVVNELKKKLYISKNFQYHDKTVIVRQLDIYIQNLEVGKPITQIDFDFILNLKNKIERK